MLLFPPNNNFGGIFFIMASSTTDYTLVNSTWLQVSTGKASVIITNNDTLPINYAVAASASDLTAVSGHEIHRLETVKLSDLGANNVFIRCNNTGGGARATVSAY